MIKINLAPRRRRRGLAISVPRLPLAVSFAILYALAISGIGGYWFLLTREADRLHSEIGRAERELAALRAAIPEGSRFRKEKEELEPRVGLIARFARRQARPVYLLEAVAEALPRDLWLTTMEEKQNRLRLGGAAFSSTAVADFMANLRRSGTCQEVDLVLARQDPAKTPRLVSFEVSCGIWI